MDPATFGTGFGLITLIFAAFLLLAIILLPFYVAGAYSQLRAIRRQNNQIIDLLESIDYNQRKLTGDIQNLDI